MDPLTLTIVFYLFKSLQQYHISKLSSTLFLLLSISLFVVYTVNLPVVRPRSCRVIYYFDTPTLGRRHQLFDHVRRLPNQETNERMKIVINVARGTCDSVSIVLDLKKIKIEPKIMDCVCLQWYCISISCTQVKY